MNLAKLWFWEFTEDPYDIVLATCEASAKKARSQGFDLPGEPRRMTRDEVLAAWGARPTPMFSVFERMGDSMNCALWLMTIEAAQKREAYEAELAARQVELFT